MRNFILLSLFILLTFAGCTSTETTENTTDAVNAVNKPVNADANTTSSTTNAPAINTVSTPPPTTVNQAETLMPVVRAYCEAIRKKDDAGLKKVLSAETFNTLERDAKDDGKSSVAEFLNSIEDVGTKPCGTRNEQINGNTAIAEVTTESMPNGARIKFVKENGDWKMTNESPDVPVK